MYSYWEKSVLESKYDFTIIGAGFSGLWTAYFLLKIKPKAKVLILEKNHEYANASTKNAGFACFGSPTELLKNIEVIGLEKTLYWTKKRFDGIGIIKKLVGNKCDYHSCGGTELFEEKMDIDKVLSNIPSLNKNLKPIVNSHDHFYLDNDASNYFPGYPYAISNKKEGAINPIKLYNWLKGKLMSSGVEIKYNANVLKIETQNLILENGYNISSAHTIVCTNALTSKLLPNIKIEPQRAQVIISKPIKGIAWDGTFHIEEGYYYFRKINDRILLGGGRNLDFKTENTTELELTDIIQIKLKEILTKKISPNTPIEIDYAWSGTMGFTSNGEPVCEVLSDTLSINVGLNGMGVALAPTLGMELAERLV